jgi:hypothetical protein
MFILGSEDKACCLIHNFANDSNLRVSDRLYSIAQFIEEGGVLGQQKEPG